MNEPFQTALLPIMVKLSGEALLGSSSTASTRRNSNASPANCRTSSRWAVADRRGHWGGNSSSARSSPRAGMDRVAADHMGLLATFMNSIAMQMRLESLGHAPAVHVTIRS